MHKYDILKFPIYISRIILERQFWFFVNPWYLRIVVGRFCDHNLSFSHVTTSLPVNVFTAQVWLGILHDLFVGSQNFPRLCLCRGHTQQLETSLSITSNLPDLAKIRLYSDKPSLDRWWVERWLSTSSVQSSNFTRDEFPRDSPQFRLAWKQTILDMLHVFWQPKYLAGQRLPP
jgi:hypothetical protein